MKKITWSDDLSVGVDLIDEQHKMLIKRLNDMSEAIEDVKGPTEIARTLEFLIDYTDFHFSAEASYMKKTGYPGLADHLKKHGEFTSTLTDLEEEFREEGATHMLAESLDTFLVNWLIKHISTVDVEFGRYLGEKGITLEGE